MKKNIVLILIVFVSFLFASVLKDNKVTAPANSMIDYSYIGVNACRLCHKTAKQGNQFDIWKNSKHANAYLTLLTEEASKIVKAKGFSKPANEIEECLKCHASGYQQSVKKEANFKVEDGVQCESCHGPGSAYKDLKIMKNKELAIKNGLTRFTDIERFCRSCHNSESPTYKSFNFAESLKKIEHKIPKN